jgi:hypothetical protein
MGVIRKGPFRFVGDQGETVSILIEAKRVGNTFTVSQPAQKVEGGGPNDDRTVASFDVVRPPGQRQSIVMSFSFPQPVPAGDFTSATRPRFDVTVCGRTGGEFALPPVRQSSTEKVPSTQFFELFFETGSVAAAPKRKKAVRAVATRKSRRKKTAGKKKTSRRRSSGKKTSSRKAGRRGKA